jgi:hypothetical protein
MRRAMGHAIVVFYLDFALAVAASWVLVKLAGLVGRIRGSDDDDDSGGGRGWNWKRRQGPSRPGPERSRGPTQSQRRPPVGRGRPRTRR